MPEVGGVNTRPTVVMPDEGSSLNTRPTVIGQGAGVGGLNTRPTVLAPASGAGVGGLNTRPTIAAPGSGNGVFGSQPTTSSFDLLSDQDDELLADEPPVFDELPKVNEDEEEEKDRMPELTVEDLQKRKVSDSAKFRSISEASPKNKISKKFILETEDESDIADDDSRFNEELKSEIETINSSLAKINQIINSRKKSSSIEIKFEVAEKVERSASLWKSMCFGLQKSTSLDIEKSFSLEPQSERKPMLGSSSSDMAFETESVAFSSY